MKTKTNRLLAMFVVLIVTGTTNSKAGVQFTGDVHTNVFNFGGPTFWIIGSTNSNAGMTVNGGSVYNLSDFGGSYLIVGQTSTSTNNFLTVSGSGSMLTCGYLSSGSYSYAGLGNHYNINSGGGLTVGEGYGGGAGQGSASIGDGNLFSVSDAGSYFRTSGGNGLSANNGNAISIINGAVYQSGIGLGSTNTVLISDIGTSVNTGLGGISGDSFNSLTVSNGASLNCSTINFSGVSNTLVFDGTQTRCTATNSIFFSAYSRFGGNLLIQNGAQVRAGGVYSAGSPATQIKVSDPGSSLIVAGANVYLGIGRNDFDTNALMLVTNGAVVTVQVDCIMMGQSGLLAVAGTNSLVSCPTNWIYVGYPYASSNTLWIGSGGSVVAGGLSVGFTDTRTGLGNSMTVFGNLYVTNTPGTAPLQIYGAQATCNGGFITADQLICGFVNGLPGILTANSGTLQFKSAIVKNGLPFVIGDGTNTANYAMQGGTHSFASGLVISSNSVLSGCGTVAGSVTNYGTILLGGCDITFSNSVVNFGTIIATNGLPHFLSAFSNQGAFVINPPAFQTLTQSNGAFNFAWSAVEGVNYQVQYNTNLASTNWINFGGVILATNSIMTISDSLTNSQKFYRIRSN